MRTDTRRRSRGEQSQESSPATTSLRIARVVVETTRRVFDAAHAKRAEMTADDALAAYVVTGKAGCVLRAAASLASEKLCELDKGTVCAVRTASIRALDDGRERCEVVAPAIGRAPGG